MLKYILIISFSFVLISLCFLILFKGRHIWLLNQARRRGFNPKNNKPTMFHVRELLIRGEKEMAIMMYSEIYKVARKQALLEVEDLEKSIKEKNHGQP